MPPKLASCYHYSGIPSPSSSPSPSASPSSSPATAPTRSTYAPYYAVSTGPRTSPSSSPCSSPPRSPSPAALTRSNWNEQFVLAQRLPERTPAEVVNKYTRLTQLATDFVAVSRVYSQAIISEYFLERHEATVQTRALGGVAGGTKFIVRGILFKLANDTELSDGRWLYGGVQPDYEHAAKAAGHELRSAVSLFPFYKLHPGLHVPMCCTVDHLGYRMVCMPVLHLEQLVYGSDDGGATVHVDDRTFNVMIEEVAHELHLAPHYLREQLVYTGGDVEGHRGKDGRYYALDLARLLPPASPSACRHLDGSAESVFYRLLRPEFLALLKLRGFPPLSSDALTGWGQLGSDGAEHCKRVHEATRILVQEVVPELAGELCAGSVPADDLGIERLSNVLHARGVNVRHMGLLRDHCLSRAGELPHASAVEQSLLVSCVARTLKNLLRVELRRVHSANPSEHETNHAIRSFLNAITYALPDGDENRRFWESVVPDAVAARFGRIALRDAAPLFPKIAGELPAIVSYTTEQVGVRLSAECVRALARQPVGFGFHSIDIAAVGSSLVYMSVIDYAQAKLLAREAFSSHQGVRVGRLLSLAMTSFRAAMRAEPLNREYQREAAITQRRLEAIELNELGQFQCADEAYVDVLGQVFTLAEEASSDNKALWQHDLSFLVGELLHEWNARATSFASSRHNTERHLGGVLLPQERRAEPNRHLTWLASQQDEGDTAAVEAAMASGVKPARLPSEGAEDPNRGVDFPRLVTGGASNMRQVNYVDRLVESLLPGDRTLVAPLSELLARTQEVPLWERAHTLIGDAVVANLQAGDRAAAVECLRAWTGFSYAPCWSVLSVHQFAADPHYSTRRLAPPDGGDEPLLVRAADSCLGDRTPASAADRATSSMPDSAVKAMLHSVVSAVLNAVASPLTAGAVLEPTDATLLTGLLDVLFRTSLPAAWRVAAEIASLHPDLLADTREVDVCLLEQRLSDEELVDLLAALALPGSPITSLRASWLALSTPHQRLAWFDTFRALDFASVRLHSVGLKAEASIPVASIARGETTSVHLRGGGGRLECDVLAALADRYPLEHITLEDFDLRDPLALQQLGNAWVMGSARGRRSPLKTFKLVDVHLDPDNNALLELYSGLWSCRSLETLVVQQHPNAPRLPSSALASQVALCTSLQSLDLPRVVWRGTDLEDLLRELPALESLSLAHGVGISGAVFEQVAALVPGLRKLDATALVAPEAEAVQRQLDELLQGTKRERKQHATLQSEAKTLHLVSDSLAAVGQLQQLEELVLNDNTTLRDDALDRITDGCRQLRVLRISMCAQLSDAVLHTVGERLPLLEVFEAKQVADLRDAVSNVAEHCPKLREFVAVGASQLGDRHVVALAKNCADLELLDVGHTRVSDLALQHVGMHCSRLKYLSIYFCRHVGDTGIAAIAHGCPNLETMQAARCTNISDAAVVALADTCPSLKHLDVFYDLAITDRSVARLAYHCRTLEKLSVGGCPRVKPAALVEAARFCPNLRSFFVRDVVACTDDVLSAVARHCNELREITVTGCHYLTDVGLLELARHCPRIEDLVASRLPHITDAGVMAVVHACSLQQLILRNNPSLSPDLPDRIRAVLPNVDLRFGI